MIRPDQALAGITNLGFDTVPLIYFVERHPTYVDLMREIIYRVDIGSIMGYTSVITLTEILTKPKQLGQTTIENEYLNLLQYSRNFRIIPIDISIADRAADLRARYNLRTPDALQLASALSVGCQAFLTNDHDLKRVTELQVVILDDLEGVSSGRSP